MNFARNNWNTILDKRGNKEDKEKEESQNLFNQKILDSILDDDQETFSNLITQASSISDVNQQFEMTNYKFPKLISNKPSYLSLCAFFNSEKCLEALVMLAPEGLESNQMKKTDNFRRSPMHFACAGGNLNIIRELDLAGFSFDDKDMEGYQPSHYAAMAGHKDAIQYLWSKGVDLLANAYRMLLMTPLHVACLYGNIDVVKFICETVIGDEINNNQNDENQNSKLSKVINLNTHYRYYQFSTPLHLACEGGHANVLNYLLSKKNFASKQINCLDQHSCTPMIVACQNGSLECVKSLLNTGQIKLDMKNKRKHIPLVDAAAQGHLDIVQFLIKQKNIDINSENSKKINALLAAVLNDHLPIVKCLVDNKALDKYPDYEIGSLFLSACGTNDFELIKYLDCVCKVPYHITSNNKAYHWTCSHSLQLNETSTWGTQFMQQACLLENEEMVNLFLEKNIDFKGVDLSLNTQKAWTPFMDFLIKKGVDLSNCENDQGIPPIVSTIKYGNIYNVQFMISKGAKLNADIIENNDCILSACENGSYDLYSFLMEYEPVMKNGEECIKKCIFSYHRKNLKQRIKIVEDILKRGLADINKPFNNINNETLLSCAAYHRSMDILDLFSKYGADFENVPLKYNQMSLKSFWPVFEYLANHGCKFDNSVKDRMYGCLQYGIPLIRSFEMMHSSHFEIKIPLLLIDYITNEDIKKIKDNYGCIIDKLLLIKCYEGILKLFRKCECIVYPTSTNEDDFNNILLASGNTELVDFVCNYNK